MRWLIALFLFMTLQINAQKCTYRVNSVSGMDGTRLVITEPVDLIKDFANGVLQVWTTIYGDTALVLAFVFIDTDEIELSKGDQISLFTKDEVAINLEIFQQPVKTSSTPIKTTCLTLVNPENIVTLEKAQITKIQFTGEKYRKEGIIKKKKSIEAIGTLVDCVKEYME